MREYTNYGMVELTPETLAQYARTLINCVEFDFNSEYEYEEVDWMKEGF